MKYLVELLAKTTGIIAWLAGIALATSLGQVIAAIVFPPFAWYQVVAFVMRANGFVN